MLLDTVIQSVDTLISQVNSSVLIDEEYIFPWKYMAIVELIILVILIIKQFHRTSIEMSNELLTAKNSKINTDELMSDIFKSKKLYEELIRVCHPDRFVDEGLKEYMTLQCQKITENKNNYQKLLIIKKEIEETYPNVLTKQ